jgi:hypothetical protein
MRQLAHSAFTRLADTVPATGCSAHSVSHLAKQRCVHRGSCGIPCTHIHVLRAICIPLARHLALALTLEKSQQRRANRAGKDALAVDVADVEFAYPRNQLPSRVIQGARSNTTPSSSTVAAAACAGLRAAVQCADVPRMLARVRRGGWCLQPHATGTSRH